jgi:butyryl-CoA dehydrogenase
MLTEEHRIIRDSIRSFAQERIAPFSAQWDKSHTFPRETLQELAELGVMGITIPEGYGGAGMDYRALALILEEIAAADGAVSTIVSVQNSLPCGILHRYGNEEQKQSWLTRLARGTALGCFCLSEPQAGSDAAALRTTAVRASDAEGGGWIINGVKQFITTGKHADVAIVFAVTDRTAGKKGISCFLVPTATPGYVVARLEDKMGQHASDTAQILFENCRVEGGALIGAEGAGYRIALSNLEAGRIGIAAQSVGMARAAMQAALRYARERESFGRPIIEHQAVSFRLADMATQLEAARQLVWFAASLKDAGESCLTAASMAKLFASEVAEKVCSDAIQIHGGYGYVSEFPVERIYRDVRVCQIYEGASDIQRLVIGRSLAGSDQGTLR